MAETLTLRINGRDFQVKGEADRSLLNVLRNDLGLTGSKYGCGEGQCGACTILIDGQPQPSCITSLAEGAGREIRTIEGVASNGVLHPIQQAFLQEGALQCGYCTPGLIMASLALLEENPSPSEGQIRSALEGHICRCGTYRRIIAAIQRAARILKEGRA